MNPLMGDVKENQKPDEGTPLIGAISTGNAGAFTRTLLGYFKTALLPLAVYFIGVGSLCHLEGWSFLTSNYVVTQIITTIGYGDFTVTETGAKIFMAFYGMTVIVVLAYYHSELIGKMASWECEVLRKYLRSIENEALEEIITDEEAGTRFAAMNQALASLALFLPILMFGTVYFRLEEHCSCSYGISRKEGCDDSSYELCVATEGYEKDWASSFYMSAITLTTIGFGDFQPRTALGRVVGIVWMIIGTVVTATCLGSLSNLFFASSAEKKFNAKDTVAGIDAEVFSLMDTDKNGYLTRGEFLAYTLVKYNLVDADLMKEINRQYDILDNVDPIRKNVVTLAEIQRQTLSRRSLSQSSLS